MHYLGGREKKKESFVIMLCIPLTPRIAVKGAKKGDTRFFVFFFPEKGGKGGRKEVVIRYRGKL